jgi:hypothetical protein
MDDIIGFNVGGRVHQTSLTTLSSLGPNLLSQMAEHLSNKTMSVKLDPSGNIFIDRDPKAFAVILEFLRNGTMFIPRRMAWQHICSELDFYCIPYENAKCVDNAVGDTFGAPAFVDTAFGDRLNAISAKGTNANAAAWMQGSGSDLPTLLASAAASGSTQTSKVFDISPFRSSIIDDQKAARAAAVAVTGLIGRTYGGVKASACFFKARKSKSIKLQIDFSW